MCQNSVHILLVEDDAIDAEQFVRSFRRANIPHPIRIAHDGVDALDHLRGTGGHERLPRPNLILLDLNMPRMNGLEFLRELRSDEHLRHSVVFVLTTSDRLRDMRAAYNAHVAGYFLKRSDMQTDELLIKMLADFAQIAKLPQDPGGCPSCR